MKTFGLLAGAGSALFLVTFLLRGHERDDEPKLGTHVLCQAYTGRPAGWLERPTAGMVQVEGGTFVPGSTQGYPEERPAGPVQVGRFWIDRTEVTNAQFGDFVAATGYASTAEESGSAPVFHVPTQAELQERDFPWWTLVVGASWRHPDGGDSEAVPQQPVVQITLADALAYARWLGRTLPTEAEWEFAARAGRDDATLHRAPKSEAGEPLANFWQGEFPTSNTAEDGFVSRAPVGCYAPNPFQLYDMIGNVWEWTTDSYRSPHAPAGTTAVRASANDGRVIKGGSFLCASNFCARYRVSARHRQESATPAAHLGFRTVLRVPASHHATSGETRQAQLPPEAAENVAPANASEPIEIEPSDTRTPSGCALPETLRK